MGKLNADSVSDFLSGDICFYCVPSSVDLLLFSSLSYPNIFKVYFFFFLIRRALTFQWYFVDLPFSCFSIQERIYCSGAIQLMPARVSYLDGLLKSGLITFHVNNFECCAIVLIIILDSKSCITFPILYTVSLVFELRAKYRQSLYNIFKKCYSDCICI